MGLDNTFKQNKIIIEWYDEHSESIFKYIFSMIKDYHQAEDLTQDTFIRVFNYISSGKKITYPKTFIYRIAHHITVDYIRKHASIKIMTDVIFHKKMITDSSIENHVLISEQFKELYKAIVSLKVSYRQVIILRKMQGFSIKETADILNWSESKVKTTLFRATKALGKKLKERGYTYETY